MEPLLSIVGSLQGRSMSGAVKFGHAEYTFTGSVSKPMTLNPAAWKVLHSGNPTYPRPITPTTVDLELILWVETQEFFRLPSDKEELNNGRS